MLGIKKLNLFIIRNFFLLFIATFFICLFIYIMQFLWMYIDDLVGKGLSLNILAKFFWYASLTMVSMALPLAILLAALMSFGNMGEQMELLAMKAAGISLFRTMAPLIVTSIMLGSMSFYFQNVIGPNAQIKLWTLLFSMRQKSPELDIPEGQFYNQIEGYNLFVNKKNKNTGELYNVMIYNFADGFDNAHIIVADSAKLEMTADKKYLRLHLFGGEQFENLQSQSSGISSMNGALRNTPYRRETFQQKHVIINFNANFSMISSGFMSSAYQSKNMMQIQSCIDSMHAKVDSAGRVLYKQAMMSTYAPIQLTKADTIKAMHSKIKAINADSVIELKPIADRNRIYGQASVDAGSQDWDFKGVTQADTQDNITRYTMEWHRRIALSLACVVFFFIGAPLGGIIRKGGLGMPVVISVLFFIFYYVVDTAGYKAAKTGAWPPVLGMWASTLVLAPIGAFLTYKSNKDSVILNADIYRKALRIFFGYRETRKMFMKEVVIETPDYDKLKADLSDLSVECETYGKKRHLLRLPNYVRLFLMNGKDKELVEIDRKMEDIIEEISNCQNAKVLDGANKFPILSMNAHRSPWRRRGWNVVTGALLPFGIFFYIRICGFRFRLYRDLRQTIRTCKDLQERINEYI